VGTEQLNTSYNVVDVAGFSDDDLKTVVTYSKRKSVLAGATSAL